MVSPNKIAKPGNPGRIDIEKSIRHDSATSSKRVGYRAKQLRLQILRGFSRRYLNAQIQS